MVKFEVKLKYKGLGPTGQPKVFKPTVMIGGESFSDVEKQAFQEYDGTEEFEVEGIKKSKISEIIAASEVGDHFFNCQVEFITIDEKKGVEKKSKVEYLVLADNNDIASERVKEFFKDSVSDYRISKLALSPISELINLTF